MGSNYSFFGTLVFRLSAARRARTPVSAHPAFVTVLTIWGAALTGLSVAVLSPAAIARIAAIIGTGEPGAMTRLVFSVVSALVGGGLASSIGMTVHRRTVLRVRGNTIIPSLAGHWDDVAIVNEPVEPIDPASELGSKTLDDPLTEMPFAAESREPTPADVSGETELNSDPPGMTLMEFGALPGRDRAWVFDPPPSTRAFDMVRPAAKVDEAPDMEAHNVPKPAKGPTRALEQLRGTRTEDLGLLQMIERLAAALHGRGEASRDARRDAALAKELRALPLLAPGGLDPKIADPAT